MAHGKIGKEQSQIIQVSISRKKTMTSTQPEGSAILDATKNCAGPATATEKKSKATPERDLPTGVYKQTSGKFVSFIRWGGKKRYIATFDTPEEASAAYVSVEKDRDDVELHVSALGADEVNTFLFDAARKKATEAVGGSFKETSERDLPTGVYKFSTGKFVSMIGWGGKTRNIGSFDTPEQASAAFMSVRKDRDDANLSAQSADEVDVLFYAAKRRALEAVGGTRKKKLPQGVKKLSSGKFQTQITWKGKERYIGTFDTPEQASTAYLSAKTDLAYSNVSEAGADEVNAAFDAAKTRALEAVGGNSRKKRRRPKATSERDLPTGVYKASSGKFASLMQWNGKTRYIGTFDTPDQASAAYVSVKTDLAHANVSAAGTDEVNATFDAAKNKALESFSGRKRSKSTSERDLPKGVHKTSSGKFASTIGWGGKNRNIGSFDTSEQASAAFMSARKDREDANLSAQSADEVDVLFYVAKRRALEAVGGTSRKNRRNAKSERELPQGVYKATSGKFQTLINWGGKTRSIGTFDTPEQASAAHVSVKTDLAYANVSEAGADEVNATFDAAKKKAVDAVGGTSNRKRGPPKDYKLPCPDDGERKTKHKRKLAELASAAGTGVSENQRGLQRAGVGHGEKIGKNGADHQATSERDLSGIFDPEVDGVLV